MTLRIALVSDIHGNVAALEAAVAAVAARSHKKKPRTSRIC